MLKYIVKFILQMQEKHNLCPPFCWSHVRYQNHPSNRYCFYECNILGESQIQNHVTISFTVKFPSIRMDRCEQTVQTQIRLLLMEQSDQGLHCLLFHPHLFECILASVKPYRSTFTTITVIMIMSQFLEILR